MIKASSVKIPKIPILVNKAALREHTLLLALDDPVVARAREEDKCNSVAKKGEYRVRRWPWVSTGYGACVHGQYMDSALTRRMRREIDVVMVAVSVMMSRLVHGFVVC